MAHALKDFVPLNIAVLTLSDTRSFATDTSGDALVEGLTSAGHQLADRVLIPDDRYAFRAIVSQWIADSSIHAVLITGGTGFTARDSTPEAILPLLDKVIDGFGELFRARSLEEIGTSTMQSRALAGLANQTVIFCMPGSTGACRTGWSIIRDQLDASHRPCNFVELLVNKPQLEAGRIQRCATRG